MPSQKTRRQEVIGRTQLVDYLNVFRPSTALTTVDTTTLDYEWWDKFRNGMQPGYEIASRLVAPIARIRSVWALGDGVDFRLRATLDLERIIYTNDQLKEWATSIRSLLATLVKDLDELADQYVIVNLDGSLSVPSPNTVTVDRDLLDYRRVVSVTVTSILKDVEIKDIYREDRRTLQIKNTTAQPLITRYGTIEAKATQEFVYDNPLGVIPVVCFHNRRSANETNGRVIYAADMLLLSRYDDLASKTIDASALMGTPIPVWENVSSVQDEKAALETVNGHYEPNLDGIYEPVSAINFDPNAGMFTTGAFSFKGPPIGFTKDIRDTLKLLFLLILEEHQIPETIWGGEMGQARATSVVQMKTFHSMIKGYRLDLEGTFEPEKGRIEGMIGLASLWLRTKALTDKKLVVDAIAARWPALDEMDETIMLDRVKYLHDGGMLSDVTTVELLDVVEDPAGEVEKAKAEAAAKQDAFDAAMNADLQNDPLVDPNADPNAQGAAA